VHPEGEPDDGAGFRKDVTRVELQGCPGEALDVADAHDIRAALQGRLFDRLRVQHE